MSGLLHALGFLTILPVRPGTPAAGQGDISALGRAARWFPFVGLALGAILAYAHLILMSVFPPLLASGLLVALWAFLTGGLHLDGLADCCDGLFVSASRERRLEIMRDSHLGAFGGIGLTLFLFLKAAAVSALPAGRGSVPLSFALLLAPTLARWVLLPVARLRPARPGGLGDTFAASLTPVTLLLAAILPLALLVVGGRRALAAVGGTIIIAASAAGVVRARLGGVTGDVLGMVIEVSELTVLTVFGLGLRV